MRYSSRKSLHCSVRVISRDSIRVSKSCEQYNELKAGIITPNVISCLRATYNVGAKILDGINGLRVLAPKAKSILIE